MSTNWSEYSLNGCLFEDAPKPSPMLGAPVVDLPQRVDLRVHCPPVESQLTTLEVPGGWEPRTILIDATGAFENVLEQVERALENM